MQLTSYMHYELPACLLYHPPILFYYLCRAFLLRDGPPGRVPQRTFTRMLAPVTSQISGVLIGEAIFEGRGKLSVVKQDGECV